MARRAAAKLNGMFDVLQVVLVVEDLLVAAARPVLDVVHGADLALGLDIDLLRQNLSDGVNETLLPIKMENEFEL